MINSSRKLGSTLGVISREQSDIKSNLSANEHDANAIIKAFENLKVYGELVVTKKVYASDSFIVDHPLFGVVDSSVLKIDGGYDASQDVILFDKKF